MNAPPRILLAFVVEGEPRPKVRARVTKRGTYTPSQGDEDAFAAHALQAMLRERQKKITGPVRVDLDFFRKTARRVDLDNLAKLSTDAMTGPVWEDDSLIVDLRCTKQIDRDRPRTAVRVWAA